MDEFVCRLCGHSSYTTISDMDISLCDGCGVVFSGPSKFSLPIVKFLKLDPDAVIPARAKEGDVGYDAVSIMDKELFDGCSALIKTGISVELPPHTELQVRARSGLAYKSQIMVTNGPGTIDTGYRGEIGVLLTNMGGEKLMISKGDKIAQFLLTTKLPYTFQEVELLSDTDRGEGGFGHTGK
jgi:dUTP pyrophosphatase